MTTPPVRESSHCWAHVNRQTRTNAGQPSVLDEGREATCSNTQQTASPSILHDEQQPRESKRPGCRPFEAHAKCLRPLNRRSLVRRLHPIGLSNFLAAAEVTGTRLPRWNQPPELRQCLVMKL